MHRVFEIRVRSGADRGSRSLRAAVEAARARLKAYDDNQLKELGQRLDAAIKAWRLEHDATPADLLRAGLRPPDDTVARQGTDLTVLLDHYGEPLFAQVGSFEDLLALYVLTAPSESDAIDAAGIFREIGIARQSAVRTGVKLLGPTMERELDRLVNARRGKKTKGISRGSRSLKLALKDLISNWLEDPDENVTTDTPTPDIVKRVLDEFEAAIKNPKLVTHIRIQEVPKKPNKGDKVYYEYGNGIEAHVSFGRLTESVRESRKELSQNPD